MRDLSAFGDNPESGFTADQIQAMIGDPSTLTTDDIIAIRAKIGNDAANQFPAINDTAQQKSWDAEWQQGLRPMSLQSQEHSDDKKFLHQYGPILATLPAVIGAGAGSLMAGGASAAGAAGAEGVGATGAGSLGGMQGMTLSQLAPSTIGATGASTGLGAGTATSLGTAGALSVDPALMAGSTLTPQVIESTMPAWAVPAAIGGAGLATGIAGGVMSANAIKSSGQASADAVKNAATQTTDLSRDIYNSNIKLQQPFYDAGTKALPQLSELVNSAAPSYQSMVTDKQGAAPSYADMVTSKLGDQPSYDKIVTDAKYTESPVYKYLLEQRTREMNRNLATRNLSGGGTAVSNLRQMQGALSAEDFTRANEMNKDRYTGLTNDYGIKLGTLEKGYGAGTNEYNDLYKRNVAGYGAATQERGDKLSQLGDLVSLGSGSANTMQGAGNTYGTLATDAIKSIGSANSDQAKSNGQADSALFSGLGSLPLNLASLGVQAGWKPFSTGGTK